MYSWTREATQDGIDLSIKQLERGLDVVDPGGQPGVEDEDEDDHGNDAPRRGREELRDRPVERSQNGDDQLDGEGQEFDDLMHEVRL